MPRLTSFSQQSLAGFGFAKSLEYINFIESSVPGLQDSEELRIDTANKFFNKPTLLVNRTTTRTGTTGNFRLPFSLGFDAPWTMEFWIKDLFGDITGSASNTELFKLKTQGSYDVPGPTGFTADALDLTVSIGSISSGLQGIVVGLTDGDGGTIYQRNTIEGWDQATDNTDWTHLAFVAEDNLTMAVYVDGQKLNELTDINANRATLNLIDFTGRDTANNNTFMDGYEWVVLGGELASKQTRFLIGEVRFSSIARYTTTFTPPSQPFVVDSSTQGYLYIKERNRPFNLVNNGDFAVDNIGRWSTFVTHTSITPATTSGGVLTMVGQGDGGSGTASYQWSNSGVGSDSWFRYSYRVVSASGSLCTGAVSTSLSLETQVNSLLGLDGQTVTGRFYLDSPNDIVRIQFEVTDGTLIIDDVVIEQIGNRPGLEKISNPTFANNGTDWIESLTSGSIDYTQGGARLTSTGDSEIIRYEVHSEINLAHRLELDILQNDSSNSYI